MPEVQAERELIFSKCSCECLSLPSRCVVAVQKKLLKDLRPGESGIIAQIDGGHGMVNRLAALGIRPGKRITKLSSVFMRGPVTIRVDRAQVAIGFGMAKRILVEVEDTAR